MIKKLLCMVVIVTSSFCYAQKNCCGNAHLLYICNNGTIQFWKSNSIGELGNCPSKPEKNLGLIGINTISNHYSKTKSQK